MMPFRLGLNFLIIAVVIVNFLARYPQAIADTAATSDQIMRADLEFVFSELDEFKKACGSYPTTGETLRAIHHNPRGHKCSYMPPLTEGDPRAERIFEHQRDVWNQPLKYQSNGNTYSLKASHGYSLTPDSPLHGNYHWTNPNPPPDPPPPHQIPGTIK